MIYLDNGATSFPKPERVLASVEKTIRMGSGTPGRGSHEKALAAGYAVEKARRETARFFGLFEDFRAIFTYSATDALNMAIKGFVRKGDKVLMSAVEHNSTSRQLFRMKRDKYIDLDIVRCDEKGFLDMEDLEKKTGTDTKLVVISHASNVTGALQNIELAGRIVREKGSFLLLDAAQTVARVPIDMGTMPVDMVAFAGHKGLFSLQGVGGLLIGERVRNLKPFREGGTGFDSASEIQPAPWPEAFEAGTCNVPGIVSLYEGIKFIKETGLENIAAAEKRKIRIIRDFLAGLDAVRIYGPGPDEPSVSLISFNIKGWEPEDVGAVLSGNYEIAVRTGLQCAPLAHKCIGTFPAGTVRVSPGYFTTDEEINIFCKAVRVMAETLVPVY